MSRKPREIKPGYCYHITIRCNNREFQLTHHECRQVIAILLIKFLTPQLSYPQVLLAQLAW